MAIEVDVEVEVATEQYGCWCSFFSRSKGLRMGQVREGRRRGGW